jgi:hypothetical protein
VVVIFLLQYLSINIVINHLCIFIILYIHLLFRKMLTPPHKKFENTLLIIEVVFCGACVPFFPRFVLSVADHSTRGVEAGRELT